MKINHKTMSIEQQTLEELKKLLLEEKNRIENELGRIAKQTTSGDYETTFSEIGTDEDENASEVEEYTDNLSIETNLQKQLKETIEALERINTGTYGKCENCDAEIPIDRLRVYPAAKKCLNCK